MAKLDFDRIRRSAQEMTDAELETALATQREDYVPEALEVMSSELERRSVNPRERIPSDASPRPVVLKWLIGYVTLTAVSSFGSVIAWLAGVWSEDWLTQLVVATASIVIAYHLNQRLRWAWWANTVLLGFLTLRGLSNFTQLGPLLGAVWAIGNGFYFYRERRHFTES